MVKNGTLLRVSGTILVKTITRQFGQDRDEKCELATGWEEGRRYGTETTWGSERRFRDGDGHGFHGGVNDQVRMVIPRQGTVIQDMDETEG